MGVPGHPAGCESAAPMISGSPQALPLETTPTSPGLAVVWCIWNEALRLKSPWDKYVLFIYFIFFKLSAAGLNSMQYTTVKMQWQNVLGGQKTNKQKVLTQ